MKNLTLLSVLLLFIVSCGSDDAETVTAPVVPPASIVGKWKLEKIFYENAYEDLDQCEKLNTVDFHANNTVHEQDYYTGSNNVCTEQTPLDGAYVLQDNALRTTYNGNLVYNETVVELTATKLVLTVDERYNGPDGGEPYTVTYSRVN